MGFGFAMYGYGGFGYDTSHVKPDGHHSELYWLAEKGDLRGVTDLVEKIKDSRKTAKCINQSRRWTEVDYKDSGFTKEFEWNDLTPVSIAARRGHTDVLKYLLMKHADPTLRACYCEDAYSTTQDEAQGYLDSVTKQVMTLQSQTSSPPFQLIPLQGNTPEEKATEIYLRLKQARHNVYLVEEALKFWDTANYAHARDNRKTFTNKPKNGLEQALQTVKVPVIGDDPKDTDEIAPITKSFIRLEKYLATKRDEMQKKLNQENESKKNQRRDSRGFTKKDTDDIRPKKKARMERKRGPAFERRVLELLTNGKPNDICTLTSRHQRNGHKICECQILNARRERMKQSDLQPVKHANDMNTMPTQNLPPETTRTKPIASNVDTKPTRNLPPGTTKKKPSWQWTCQLCQYEMKLDRKATRCACCGGAKGASLDDPLNEKNNDCGERLTA